MKVKCKICGAVFDEGEIMNVEDAYEEYCPKCWTGTLVDLGDEEDEEEEEE